MDAQQAFTKPNSALPGGHSGRQKNFLCADFPGPVPLPGPSQPLFFFPVSEAMHVINLSPTLRPAGPAPCTWEPAATYVVWLQGYQEHSPLPPASRKTAPLSSLKVPQSVCFPLRGRNQGQLSKHTSCLGGKTH